MPFMYLKVIIVFYQVPESHVDHIDHTLNLLGKAGIKLKLKKLFLFHKTFQYLENLIPTCFIAI